MLWVFVAAACLARFIHLDADPKFESWIFYVQDEGRWIEGARNLALFGELGLYGILQLHLALSPAFQAVNYAVFELAGASFWSARIWSAACGAAIVLFSYLWLRRRAYGFPLYLGLVVLAFEPLTLSLGRTAVPEVPSLLFTLLAFIAICAWPGRVLGVACSGLFMAGAIAMKATTVLMVPVFLLAVALSGGAPGCRQRALRCAAFVLGMLVPAAVGVVVALTAGIVKLAALPPLSAVLLRSLHAGDLYMLLSRFFEMTVFANINLLLLGAWVSSWILPFRKEYRGTPLGEVYTLSGVWAAGWLLVWLPIHYTPERYSVHVILPLAIHLVAGLGLWRSVGPARVLARIEELRVRWGIAFFAWLVLPAAVIVAGAGMALVGLADPEHQRLSYRVLAIVAAAGVLAVLARAAPAGDGVVTGFMAFAVLAALLRMVVSEAGAIALSRPAAERILPFVNVVMFAGVAWYCRARSRAIAGLLDRGAAKALALGLVLTGLLCQDAPTLLQPTYTIRDASRETARLFPDAVMLHSSGAGSLLLETKLRYRDLDRPGPIVNGILDFDRHAKPGPQFALVATYRLAVHPRYDFTKSRPQSEGPGVALLNVYRNTQPDLPLDAIDPGGKQ